ncbi:MAG: leucine-rich repeat domain-containing protein [Clostridiales bacterium]|nr:leucine-rich repeat domain-containing protein [Clostridiales bacterium]
MHKRFIAAVAVLPVLLGLSIYGSSVKADDTITVTYDANGGSIDGENISIEEISKGSHISLEYRAEKMRMDGFNYYDVKDERVLSGIKEESYNAEYPKRDGYVCVGWQIAGKEDQTPVDENSGYKALLKLAPEESVTLKAVWEKTYTVKLDYNGGKEMGKSSAEYHMADGWTLFVEACCDQTDDNKRYPYTSIEKDGYGIIGWREKGSTDKTLYPIELGYEVKKDVTLEAVWGKEIHFYFDSMGKPYTYPAKAPSYGYEGSGDFSKASIVTLAGLATPVSISYYYPENADKEWAYGWTIEGDKSGKIYYYDDKYTADSDVTFQALWGAQTTITYDGNGGIGARSVFTDLSMPGSRKITNQCVGAKTLINWYSSDIAPKGYLEDDLIKPGYRFAGWKIKGSDDSKLYKAGDAYIVRKDMVLEAQWEKDDKVSYADKYEIATIRYDANGGKFTDKDLLDAPYSDEEDSWRAFFESGMLLKFSKKDPKIKAGYVDTLYTKAQAEASADGTTDSLSVCKPFVIEREGYEFEGWTIKGDKSGKVYKTGDLADLDFTERTDSLGGKEIVLHDMTFVAQWKEVKVEATATATPTPSPTETPSVTPEVSVTPAAPVLKAGDSVKTADAEYTVTSSGDALTAAYKAPVNAKAKSIKIPATVTVDGKIFKVTEIADNAFKGNKNITNVSVGKSVTVIGKNAFSGAKKLKSVQLGTAVTTIRQGAFSNCKALTSVTIGAKVKTIAKNAFSGCSKLKTIKVKTTLLKKNSVGANAFKGINKKAVFKVPKKKLKSYKQVFNPKTGFKNTMNIQ